MEREIYEVHKLGSRLVSIVLPETFEEWRESVAAGYAVATTAEQRASWDLEPAQDIPNIPQSEIVELVFLAPDDEALDEIQGFNPYANTDITPEEDAGEVVLGPDQGSAFPGRSPEALLAGSVGLIRLPGFAFVARPVLADRPGRAFFILHRVPCRTVTS